MTGFDLFALCIVLWFCFMVFYRVGVIHGRRAERNRNLVSNAVHEAMRTDKVVVLNDYQMPRRRWE